MNKPLVSIIMAVYNQENFVAQAIESAIGQTYKNWEFIIYNDGSTDNTALILNKYAGLFPEKIKVTGNGINRGVSYARNQALKEARGDYMAFLDSDDWWEKEKISKQVSFILNSEKTGLLFTCVNVISAGALPDSHKLLLERNFNKPLLEERINNKQLIRENNICFSSLMIPKKVLAAGISFDDGLIYQAEDWLFALKISYLFDLAFIPERLVNYRLHKDSYSARVFLKKRMERAGFKQIYSRANGFALKHLLKKGSSSIRERLIFICSLCRLLYEEEIINLIRGNKFLKPLIKVKKTAGYLKRLIQRLSLISSKKLLILFVTSRCNSKCRTCFYRQNLNTRGDLKLNDLKNIINSLPKTQCVLLTGGEPFLRGDIEEVIKAAIGNRNILSVAINTNGTFTDAIYSIVERVLSQRGSLKPLHINVSLDGPSDVHNMVRGIECYDKALSTLKRMEELKSVHGNFFVSAVTVISKDNLDQISDFARLLYEKMNLSFHYFEIIRGAPYDASLLEIDAARLDKLYNEIALLQELYLKRNGLTSKEIKRQKDRFTHLFRLQFENFTQNKPWDIKCMAGRNSFTVYEDGAFSVCELRKVVVNLKDYGFNMKKALHSRKVKEEIGKVDREQCFCTHGCFIANSIP